MPDLRASGVIAPKVTVLMPVYNQAEFVGKAIESILVQSFEDFEFLIVDDGSTDRTAEVIDSYEDSRIELLQSPSNLGISQSLNKALKVARGQYVARIDSDDIAEPERLARQVAFLERNPSIVLVGSGYQEVDDQGNLLGIYSLPSDCFALRWGLAFYTPFLSSSVMFRKEEVVANVGFYNQTFNCSQDHELWSRIAARYAVANLDECLVKYRVHPDSMTSYHSSEQHELLFESCQAYISSIADKDDVNLSIRARIGKARFRDAQFLLGYSESNDFTQISYGSLEETIEVIVDLHQAFTRSFQLPSLEKAKSYAQLRAMIANRLVVIASSWCSEEPYRALRLLRLSLSLKRSKMLSKGFVKTSVKAALELGKNVQKWHDYVK